MKAFIHLKDFEERASFSSWLTRIAINTALMLLRKKAFTLRSRPAAPTMISAFGNVGNPGILLKAPKTVAHGESRKSCLREQFKGCRSDPRRGSDEPWRRPLHRRDCAFSEHFSAGAKSRLARARTAWLAPWGAEMRQTA